MQACYGDLVVFNDEVFVDLDARHVKAMWQMLISRGKDLSVTYGPTVTRGKMIYTDWTANYTFSQTGRAVINHVRACMAVRDGKIVQHTDRFNFHTWAKQALGMKGMLLGHTKFLKNKVRKAASHSLENFINRQDKNDERKG